MLRKAILQVWVSLPSRRVQCTVQGLLGGDEVEETEKGFRPSRWVRVGSTEAEPLLDQREIRDEAGDSQEGGGDIWRNSLNELVLRIIKQKDL